MVCVPSETPWINTIFLFVSSYQLETVSWLGVGDNVQFFISMLGPCPVWTCVDPVGDAIVPVSSYVDLEDSVSLVSSISPGSYHQSFCLFFCNTSPSPEDRDLMKAPHLALSVPRPVTLGILSGCASLYLFHSTAGKRLF